MSGKHSHQCGFGIDGFVQENGCGFEWSHGDSLIVAPDNVYKEGHMCPRCGLGPWTWKSDMPPASSRVEFEEEGMELVVGLLRAVVTRRRFGG